MHSQLDSQKKKVYLDSQFMLMCYFLSAGRIQKSLRLTQGVCLKKPYKSKTNLKRHFLKIYMSISKAGSHDDGPPGECHLMS